MRIPRRRGPRPKPSPFSEQFDTGVEIFHNAHSAANFIDKGVRTVNKLDLPFESFPGGHRYWKESLLQAHLEAIEEEKRRARAAGRENRRSAASRTHTKFARWVDDDGVSRALNEHPNESVCRDLWRRTGPDRELLHPDWRNDRARLTYDITDEIGICPPRHRADTVVPGEMYVHKNVLWVPVGGHRRRELDVLEIEERRVEALRQRERPPGRTGDFGTSE